MRTPVISLLATLTVVASFPSVRLNAEEQAAATAPAGRLDLDDPLLPLAPKQPRAEEDVDRLHAVSLFAAGRMLEQKQKYAAALRLYQRALRYDPQALPVLRDIVPLAFSLDRPDEAMRYALKMAELDASDPVLLKRLAAVVADQGDLPHALTLYEKALSLDKNGASGARVMLQMELGRLYFLTERYPEAAGVLAKVADALGKPDEAGLDAAQVKALTAEKGIAYELFGEAFLEADRPQDAAAAFDKLHQIAPDAAVYAYHKARVQAKLKRPKEALTLLQAYLDAKAQSKKTEPYALLATILQDLGQQDQILPRLQELSSADPGNLWLAYYLADRYRQGKQFAEAQPLYERVLEKMPALDAYQGLAEVYHRTGRPDRFLTLLAAVAAKTDGLKSLGAPGEALLADAPFTKAVLEHARKMLATGEPDARVAHAAAVLAVESGQFEEAADFHAISLKTKPKEAPEWLLIWGLDLLKAERSSEAAAVFQRGIDDQVLPKDNPAFHFYLASALALDGKTDQALASARKAVEVQPDSARFHARVGWILYHAKRYDEAAESYRQLLAKFDADYSSSEVREVLHDARLVLSNISVEKDNLPQAEEWLEQVLDEFPEDVGAGNDLGYLWADQRKHLHRALGLIQRAVQAEPENVAYRDSLGWVFFQLGRYPEAIAELEKAASGKAQDGVILDHLGQAYLKRGDHAQALAAWVKAAAALREEADTEKLKIVETSIQNLKANSK